MKDWSVYKHISPNGKVYIGITSCKDPKMRWCSGYGYGHNEALMADVKKYGWRAFEHHILEFGLTEDDARRIELEQIEKFQSYLPDKGYNIVGNPMQETKSKRIQVLIRPSVWERLQKIAYMERHSFNDLLNEICERYAEQEAEQVTRYDEIYGEE